jgi:site-specific DNA recombinase
VRGFFADMPSKPDKLLRCGIYTRSTEHGLELEFNSLDAQHDACEAYIRSQAPEGWRGIIITLWQDTRLIGRQADRGGMRDEGCEKIFEKSELL